MTSVAIHTLNLHTSSAVLLALDDVLQGARSELVGPRAALESAHERVMDADHGRLLLWASVDRHPVAIVDTVMHHPGPTDLTFAQIAVAKQARFKGIARTLVRAAAQQAQAGEQAMDLQSVYAAVLPWAHGAQAFWASLGFEASPEWPEMLWAPLRQVESP